MVTNTQFLQILKKYFIIADTKNTLSRFLSDRVFINDIMFQVMNESNISQHQFDSMLWSNFLKGNVELDYGSPISGYSSTQYFPHAIEGRYNLIRKVKI